MRVLVLESNSGRVLNEGLEPLLDEGESASESYARLIEFADITELCLYDSVMVGTSLDGINFTYVNQVGSSDPDRGYTQAASWCACWHSNFTILFGNLGDYFWHSDSQGGQAYHVHLHNAAKLSFVTQFIEAMEL